ISQRFQPLAPLAMRRRNYVSVLKYSPLSTAVPTAIGPLGQRETACHLYEAALWRLGSFEIQMINANSKYKTSI
ncbi:MAG: hypothetical protein ACLFTI_09395, partial [Anaerolineales bacterium]